MKKGLWSILGLLFLVSLFVSSVLTQESNVKEVMPSGKGSTAEKNMPAATVFTNSLGMKFVSIPAGSFMMGHAISASEYARINGGKAEYYVDNMNREQPHTVILTNGYYMMTTEVTQKQWKKLMGGNPSPDRNCGDCPVEGVSWNEVQKFIGKLNKLEGTDKYRLPTEAEWEYACRAGSTTSFCYGNEDWLLGDYGWYNEISGYRSHPVGQRMKPNAWGLYDMHGNVEEWCQDVYSSRAYGKHQKYNPVYTGKGKTRAYRGGNYSCAAFSCRSATRYGRSPNMNSVGVGFRLVKGF